MVIAHEELRGHEIVSSAHTLPYATIPRVPAGPGDAPPASPGTRNSHDKCAYHLVDEALG